MLFDQRVKSGLRLVCALVVWGGVPGVARAVCLWQPQCLGGVGGPVLGSPTYGPGGYEPRNPEARYEGAFIPTQPAAPRQVPWWEQPNMGLGSGGALERELGMDDLGGGLDE